MTWEKTGRRAESWESFLEEGMLGLNLRGRRIQPHSGDGVFLAKTMACPETGGGRPGFAEKTRRRSCPRQGVQRGTRQRLAARSFSTWARVLEGKTTSYC